MKKFLMLMALLAMALVAAAPALAQDGETTGGTTNGETTSVVSPDGNDGDGGVVSPDTNDVTGGGVPVRGADEGTRTLPFTGGVFPVAAALGALLIAGGLVARRTIR